LRDAVYGVHGLEVSIHSVDANGSVLLAFIIWIVVGAIIGWLAGLLIQGGGFGFIVDALIGILGSALGGWLLPRLGVSLGGGSVGSVLTSIIGAIVVAAVPTLAVCAAPPVMRGRRCATAGRAPRNSGRRALQDGHRSCLSTAGFGGHY
jgi:uncharacterized membrane protein YeaQ/YmgE (transglycosylase-associated protein family)